MTADLLPSAFPATSFNPGPAPLEDIPDGTGTTATLVFGITQLQEIEVAGDRDWFAVTLRQGETYVFTQRGTGDVPLDASFLRLHDASGAQIAEGDTGTAGNARLEFTATMSGTFYIEAAAAGDAGSGTYRISMTDLIPADISTTATIAVGETVEGVVAAPFEDDWFRIELVAGETYQFLSQNPFGSGALTDTYLRLYDAGGVQLALNDDYGTLDARLFFTATTSGTYFISAEAYSSGVGRYLLSVQTDLTGVNQFSDVLDGGIGDDLILGLDGSDQLSGGDGDDKLVGGQGFDTLRGDAGRDKLVGREQSDSLRGGQGRDVLVGGDDNDRMDGGGGADSFAYRDLDEGSDTLLDFEDGLDLIDLSRLGLTFGDLTITGEGTDSRVAFGTTEILFIGIDAGQIAADDFIFA